MRNGFAVTVMFILGIIAILSNNLQTINITNYTIMLIAYLGCLVCLKWLNTANENLCLPLGIVVLEIGFIGPNSSNYDKAVHYLQIGFSLLLFNVWAYGISWLQNVIVLIWLIITWYGTRFLFQEETENDCPSSN